MDPFGELGRPIIELFDPSDVFPDVEGSSSPFQLITLQQDELRQRRLRVGLDLL